MQRKGVWKWGYTGSTFPACYFNNVTQPIFQRCYNPQCYYSIRVSHVCELELKKKKSVFKLMHPFPELHKEGIKHTGNHPNRRIKTLMESIWNWRRGAMNSPKEKKQRRGWYNCRGQQGTKECRKPGKELSNPKIPRPFPSLCNCNWTSRTAGQRLIWIPETG